MKHEHDSWMREIEGEMAKIWSKIYDELERNEQVMTCDLRPRGQKSHTSLGVFASQGFKAFNDSST